MDHAGAIALDHTVSSAAAIAGDTAGDADDIAAVLFDRVYRHLSSVFRCCRSSMIFHISPVHPLCCLVLSLSQASSQLEALEGSQGVTALTVNNDNDANGGGDGNIFSGGGGSGGGSGGSAGGAAGAGDDQAVASAFRILKVGQRTPKARFYAQVVFVCFI